MAAAKISLGTYIGTGTADGAEVHYTLVLLEKKLAWLDYKAEQHKPPYEKEGWHAEGFFECAAGAEGKPLVKFTIGGLPGQPRVGEVYEFDAEPLPGSKAYALRRQGLYLQPQPDALQETSDLVCKACGKPLGKQMVKLGNDYYHKECLVCKTCNAQLTGQFKSLEDGSRVCIGCEPRKYCEACKKVLNGPATSYGGKMYHPECFVCEECQEPLSGSIFMKKGRRLCKACVDASKPRASIKAKASPGQVAPEKAPETPPPEASAKAAPVKTPEKEPKASPGEAAAGAVVKAAGAVAPENKEPTVKLKCGSYSGKEPGENGSEVAYSLRVMGDRRCWLEKTVTTKISNSCWHAEGAFVEELDPWILRFTVERCPYGGGPSKGSIYELKVETEEAREVIVCEGVRCLFLADVPDISPEEYFAPVDPVVKEAPKAVPKPAVNTESAKLPAEGAPTRLLQGSAGVMQRPEIDKSNNVIKGEAAAAGYKAAKAVPAAAPPPATAVAAPAKPTAAPAEPAPATAEAPAATGFLSLEELKDADIWKAKGVDAAKREEYLSDDVFMTTFGMNKADFAKMPKWKRDGRKRENGLF